MLIFKVKLKLFLKKFALISIFPVVTLPSRKRSLEVAGLHILEGKKINQQLTIPATQQTILSKVWPKLQSCFRYVFIVQRSVCTKRSSQVATLIIYKIAAFALNFHHIMNSSQIAQEQKSLLNLLFSQVKAYWDYYTRVITKQY